jgi:hypothetical protein
MEDVMIRVRVKISLLHARVGARVRVRVVMEAQGVPEFMADDVLLLGGGEWVVIAVETNLPSIAKPPRYN